MSMPSRSSSLPASALHSSSVPGSSRSGVSRGAFPPRPKSVRMWVVGDVLEACQDDSAAQAARAVMGPVRSSRLVMAVLTLVLAVLALVAIARLIQEQLGN